MSAWRIWLSFVLLAVLGGGCSAKPTMPAPAPVTPALSDDLLHVGAARMDITPPIHMSLFGHGPESRIAVGTRLRLRCAAFVLTYNRAIDDAVVLVPCDLPQPSLALHQAVTDKLRLLGVPIRAHRLLIMATHTHAGPAHYFEAPFLRGPFSSSAPGYDPEVVAYLAGKIASGVAEAFAAPRPACAGWAAIDPESAPGKYPALSYNRDYLAFSANDTAPEASRRAKDAAEQEAAFASSVSGLPPDERGRRIAAYHADMEKKLAARADPRREPVSDAEKGFLDAVRRDEDPLARAVDRKLYAVRFDARDAGTETCKPTPLGVLAIFGMHPTGVENTNDLFHGDIFGFAARNVEACLADPSAPPDVRACEMRSVDWTKTPVVGLANGVEGDVSPAIRMQSFDAARSHGRLLAARILEAISQAKSSAKTPIAMKYWPLHFPSGRWDEAGDKLCATPEIGIPLAGGAHDGPTRLRVLPQANPGFRLSPADAAGRCQGNKVELRADLITSADELKFPATGPIALVRIGDGYIATAPGEMTTMTGFRARQALAEVLPAAAPIALVGLTNSYLEYFSTADEYPLQFYEAASTVYGPHSSQFLVRHFRCLAGAMQGNTAQGGKCTGQTPLDHVEPMNLDDIPSVSRFSADDEQFRWRSMAGLSFHALAGGEGWEAEIDRMPAYYTSDRQRLRVEILDRNGVVVDDDRGSSIEIRENRDGSRWRIRWLPDVDQRGGRDPRCGAKFVVRLSGRVNEKSDPLEVRCAP